MALPPGAVGSAVTEEQISMVQEVCKARFPTHIGNSYVQFIV